MNVTSQAESQEPFEGGDRACDGLCREVLRKLLKERLTVLSWSASERVEEGPRHGWRERHVLDDGSH